MRCRLSWSMVRSPDPGAARAAGWRSRPWSRFQKPPAERSTMKPSGSRSSTNKTAPHHRDGAPFLSKVGALAALSGLGRPRGGLVLGLSGRLGRPLLAGLATLLLRKALTRLRLPALLAHLLLALAHTIFPPAE